MNTEGLDRTDLQILEILKDHARMSYSEIGSAVGISRVSVRNRMEEMEKAGVIQGYKTVVDPTMVPEGMKFFIDMEVHPEQYEETLERLAQSDMIRQIYGVSGDCRIHAEGFAPNQTQLRFYANNFFRTMKGCRRIEWHTVVTTYKDMDGGVEFVRYQESEHMEGGTRGKEGTSE